MTIRCLVCDHHDSGHRYACDHCVRDIQRQLREIETYAAVLASFAIPGGNGFAGRGAPGYGSRSPARDDVIAALDIRSDGVPLGPDDVDNPTISIPGGIRYIACWLREEQELDPPRKWTITTEVAYLLGTVDYAAVQQWVTVLADLVGKLHRQARALAHDQPPRPLGTCLGVECGGPVYPTQVRDMAGAHEGARCIRCRREYTGLDLVRLSVAQEAS